MAGVGRRGAACWAILVLLAASVLGGCTAGGDQSREDSAPGLVAYRDWRPVEPVVLPELSESERQALRDRYLRQIVSKTELEGVPPAALVRWVERDELDAVLAQCFTESGFPAHVSQDGRGGVEFDEGGGVSQGSAYDLAYYECSAKYTVDARYIPEWTTKQRQVVFEYKVSWLVPCLAERGYAISEPPTQAAWVAAFPSHAWDPLMEAWSQAKSPEEARKLPTHCPNEPPTPALFG